MWATVVPAAASVLGKAVASPPAVSRSDATGGFLSETLDHSRWTVNIAGDNAGPGLLPLLAIGAGLFMAGKWASKKL